MSFTKEEKHVFYYLNDLRESGIVNMYGAGQYIRDQFGFDNQKSSKLLAKWMDNFNDEGYE